LKDVSVECHLGDDQRGLSMAGQVLAEQHLPTGSSPGAEELGTGQALPGRLSRHPFFNFYHVRPLSNYSDTGRPCLVGDNLCFLTLICTIIMNPGSCAQRCEAAEFIGGQQERGASIGLGNAVKRPYDDSPVAMRAD